MRQKNGFTLLEVLVATVIMAVAVGGALSALSGSMRNAGRLTEVDRASMLARRKMDELLTEKRIQRGVMLEGQYDPALAGGQTAGWRAMVAAYEVPAGVTPATPVLDRIQVEIWWMVGDQRRTWSLDSYRKSYYTAQEIAGGALLAR